MFPANIKIYKSLDPSHIMLREIIEQLFNLQQEKLLNEEESIRNTKFREETINQEILLVNKILKEESMEENIILEYITTSEIDEEKDYLISYQEYEQLKKEKYLIEGIRNIFHKEIEELKIQLNILEKSLREELLNKNQKDLQSKIFSNITIIINKISSQEKEIKKYLEIIKNLKYDKKSVEKGRVYAQKMISGPLSKAILPALTLNIFKNDKAKFKVKIEGLENIPKIGSCIIAPHHHHAAVDPIIIKAIIDRPIFFMASTETFLVSKSYGNFLKSIGTIPFTRDDGYRKRITPPKLKEKVLAYNNPNNESLIRAIRHLEIGDVLVIFPEDDAKVFFPTYKREKDSNGRDVEFVEPKTGIVYLAYAVKKKDNINIEGEGARGDSNLKKVKFKKNVTVVVQDPKAKAAGPTVITCDGPLTIDYEKNIAHFKENVVAQDARGKLSADIMDVYYNKVSRQVAKIVALGNVVIENPDGNKTYSDSVIYLADEGRIILGGDAEALYFGGDQNDGDIFNATT